MFLEQLVETEEGVMSYNVMCQMEGGGGIPGTGCRLTLCVTQSLNYLIPFSFSYIHPIPTSAPLKRPLLKRKNKRKKCAIVVLYKMVLVADFSIIIISETISNRCIFVM
jgi:hypothetical protein